MNVSEHSTRTKYRLQQGAKNYRVIGIMLGKQSGRTVEIMNTFETKFEDGNTIDMRFTQNRVAGYAEMFPEQVPLGWYSAKHPSGGDAAADQPTAQDLACMQHQIETICDNPIMMIMNQASQAAKNSKKLPFFFY